MITPATNPPMATPTTTGTTSTRAVVATLMWLRREKITAPRATAKAIPATDPRSDRRLEKDVEKPIYSTSFSAVRSTEAERMVTPVTITAPGLVNDCGVMHEDRVRAGSFGEDAEQYDRSRPSYPKELVDYIVGPGMKTVLDVGCGTGKAGRLFAERGCAVLGIEPDERMADVARRNGLEVEPGAFEEWEPSGRLFDGVVSGQAWHWVNPTLGAAKAGHVLRPGGVIALFWNQGHHEPHVKEAIDEVYERMRLDLDASSILLHPSGRERFEGAAEHVRATGMFTEPDVRSFQWTRNYTTAQWIDYLPTHSDHRILAPQLLQTLLTEVGRVVDDLGGSIDLNYHTWLVKASRQG